MCRSEAKDLDKSTSEQQSVDENSPDVPDVPHKTRQELQKPREYEQEATEIIVIAEGMVSGNGRVTNGSCGRTGWGTSNKDLWSWRGRRDNVWKSTETPESSPTQ